MKALYFKEKGKAEKVLGLTEKPCPDLSPGELKIKVLASPIHPADMMFIEGNYRIKPAFPQIAGLEGAGRVIDCGKDTKTAPGSLVAFRHKSIWAEYASVSESKVFPLPDDIPIEKACQIALNPITAWALLEQARVKAGDWLLLSAGNSVVSKIMIQLAKARGVKTLPIIRNEGQKKYLLNIGASAVLNSSTENIAEETLRITEGEGVKAALDAVGGSLATALIESLSTGGRLIHYGLYSNDLVSYHNSSVIFKNLTIQGFGIDHWLNTKSRPEIDNMLENLLPQVIDKDFELKISGKYRLDQYVKALENRKKVNEGKTLFWMEENH